jgi:hypothetical protein
MARLVAKANLIKFTILGCLSILFLSIIEFMSIKKFGKAS